MTWSTDLELMQVIASLQLIPGWGGSIAPGLNEIFLKQPTPRRERTPKQRITVLSVMYMYAMVSALKNTTHLQNSKKFRACLLFNYV